LDRRRGYSAAVTAPRRLTAPLNERKRGSEELDPTRLLAPNSVAFPRSSSPARLALTANSEALPRSEANPRLALTARSTAFPDYGASSVEQAGIIANGTLTPQAIQAATSAGVKGADLKNPVVIQELTQGARQITDWEKLTTHSVELSRGQRIQVHFYRNNRTGEVNYNVDFKVKNEVSLQAPKA
jgi:hypothetical protein